jgi:mobilome CxxCx(11)CxxC protein
MSALLKVGIHYMTEKIDQTKLNAISAKILHRKSKWKYELINNIVLLFTIIVPLMFIIAQFVAKGTAIENTINLISFVLSITLICVSVASIIFKVNDKIVIHEMGMKNNIFIASECDNAGGLSENELKWFFRYVNEMDNKDISSFANISDKVRKKIYREALKELVPGCHTITCPVCNSSPWKYKKGTCQLCGNTPKTKGMNHENNF